MFFWNLGCDNKKAPGETGRMVNICVKEHQFDVRLKHITQSALSKHDHRGHQILFNKTITIAITYFPWKYREAVEIQKHPDNLNRNNGYNISRIWKTILLVTENWPASQSWKIITTTTVPATLPPSLFFFYTITFVNLQYASKIISLICNFIWNVILFM